MREFFIKNWKIITLGILGVIFVYLLVRVFTQTEDTSELNKYKLQQIDKHIEEMKNLQNRYQNKSVWTNCWTECY